MFSKDRQEEGGGMNHGTKIAEEYSHRFGPVEVQRIGKEVVGGLPFLHNRVFPESIRDEGEFRSQRWQVLSSQRGTIAYDKAAFAFVAISKDLIASEQSSILTRKR